MFFQDAAADIFPQENQGGINQGAHQDRQFFDFLVNGFQKGCHAVNRKHPDRGSAHQGKVPFAERIKSGEKNFQTPPGKAAE